MVIMLMLGNDECEERQLVLSYAHITYERTLATHTLNNPKNSTTVAPKQESAQTVEISVASLARTSI